MTPDQSLLGRVARKLSEPPSYAARAGAKASILAVAASSYGSRPDGDEVTQPTGFDPNVAALFEAVVESAYLVANADGEFDDTERHTFKEVVMTACGSKVLESQITALLADLEDQLKEDGTEKRAQMVARTIKNPDHAREVLRIAALIAQVSRGISSVERQVLERIARECQLESSAVDAAVREVEVALAE